MFYNTKRMNELGRFAKKITAYDPESALVSFADGFIVGVRHPVV
jgi:uncharacterized protein YbgA (DUF1722 family)